MRAIILLLLLVGSGCTSDAWVRGEAPAWRRVDFYDVKSNRTGYAIIRGETADVYDLQSNRVGSMRVR